MTGFTNNLSNLPPGVSELDEHINPRDDMSDDDYQISMCGHLYSKLWVTQLDAEFSEMDDAVTAILIDMDKHQFYPNVWFVNDHGNIDLLAVNGDGTYSTVDSWV